MNKDKILKLIEKRNLSMRQISLDMGHNEMWLWRVLERDVSIKVKDVEALVKILKCSYNDIFKN